MNINEQGRLPQRKEVGGLLSLNHIHHCKMLLERGKEQLPLKKKKSIPCQILYKEPYINLLKYSQYFCDIENTISVPS